MNTGLTVIKSRRIKSLSKQATTNFMVKVNIRYAERLVDLFISIETL